MLYLRSSKCRFELGVGVVWVLGNAVGVSRERGRAGNRVGIGMGSSVGKCVYSLAVLHVPPIALPAPPSSW